jgi:hypothetical protein
VKANKSKKTQQILSVSKTRSLVAEMVKSLILILSNMVIQRQDFKRIKTNAFRCLGSSITARKILAHPATPTANNQMQTLINHQYLRVSLHWSMLLLRRKKLISLVSQSIK